MAQNLTDARRKDRELLQAVEQQMKKEKRTLEIIKAVSEALEANPHETGAKVLEKIAKEFLGVNQTERDAEAQGDARRFLELVKQMSGATASDDGGANSGGFGDRPSPLLPHGDEGVIFPGSGGDSSSTRPEEIRIRRKPN